MAVLCVILGIIMIIGGFSCMFTPLATLAAVGFILGPLLLVFGIVGIVRAIQEKGGVLEWILCILAVILGIYALVNPGSTLVFDGIIVYLFAAFFLIEGVIQIVIAFQTKVVNKNWYWHLIAGILAVILGIYLLVHPMVSAVTVGVLIGFFFIVCGFGLISLGMGGGEAEA